MQVAKEDTFALSLDHDLYLADTAGETTSIAEVQANAYRIGYQRADPGPVVSEMRSLLEQIARAHYSGLPRATRERIAAVLA
jgi:hypothetical protein